MDSVSHSPSFHTRSQPKDFLPATGSCSPGTDGSKQTLTRRRGACESCKSRKVRCDGARPCDPCYRLKKDCIYQQARFARSSFDSGGSSRKLSSERQRNSINTEQPSTRKEIPSLQTSLLSDKSHQFDLDNSITSLLWDTFDLQSPGLADIDMDLLPSSPMSLTRSHENQISNNIAPTVVFNGFGEDAISLPRNSLTSLFSTDLLDASSEGLHTPLTQSHFPSSRDEALQHGPEVDSESSSHRGWLQIPSPPDTVLESTVYRSIGSAFSWAQCEASVLSTDGMASASFQGLEPTQYDLVDCDVTELETSTLQLYSPIILDELLNECYNDPTGVRNFISLDRLKEMLQSVLRNNSNSSVKKALVYSAIAISFHLRNETQGQKNDSESFFRLSLVALTGVLLAKDTLLKLQSLIVVSIYATTFGFRCCSILITNALSCAYSLRLFQKAGVDALSLCPEEKTYAKRTLWYLYTLAQPFCQRWGLPFALDEGRIEFDVPECLSASNSRAADRTDYLLLQVQYAKLCSLTQKALYSPNVVSTPLATLDTATEFLHQQVDAWVSQLPPHLWSRGIPARERGHERRLFLQLHLQYYEVLLALDSRWLYPPSTFSKAPDQQRSQACKRCVSTAKMILESYESVRVADFLVNRTLVYPLLIAVRIIFLAVVLKWSDDDEISYLAIACGLFGRLSIGFVVPLAEVVELSGIAQQFCPAQCLPGKPSLI